MMLGHRRRVLSKSSIAFILRARTRSWPSSWVTAQTLAFPVGVILDTTLEVPAHLLPKSFVRLRRALRIASRPALTALAETMLHGVDMTLSDAASLHLCRSRPRAMA